MEQFSNLPIPIPAPSVFRCTYVSGSLPGFLLFPLGGEIKRTVELFILAVSSLLRGWKWS